MSISKRIEYYILLAFAKFISVFGIKNVYLFAYPIAYLFYFFIPIRRKVVKQNLKFAFPGWDVKTVNRVALRNYVSFAITFLEIMILGNSSKQEIRSLVKIYQIDYMKELIGKNKGVIFLTAHFGNWELGAIDYGIELGHPIDVLAKKQKNTLIAGRLKLIRERFGNREVLLGSSVRELYKVLLNKGIIGIVADQRAPKNSSIQVELFGRKTTVYAGPATIALKTRAPIIVVIMQRNQEGQYDSIIEEITYDNLPDDPEKRIIEITQRYVRVLEKAIIQTPEQWFWMHKIWKRELHQ